MISSGRARAAALVLALADDIEERCPPRGPVVVRCALRPGEFRVAASSLLGWRVRALDTRFEKAFGRLRWSAS